MRSAILGLCVALAVLPIASPVGASDAGAPSLEWVVVHDASPANVWLTRGAETSLGTANGWRCAASVRAEGNAETVTLWCSDGKVRVQTAATQPLSDPPTAKAALAVTGPDGNGILRGLSAGVRRVTP